MTRYNSEHVGKRIQYTDRNGRVEYGSIREVIEATAFVDVDLNNRKRAKYYVPDDTVELLTDEQIATLDALQS